MSTYGTSTLMGSVCSSQEINTSRGVPIDPFGRVSRRMTSSQSPLSKVCGPSVAQSGFTGNPKSSETVITTFDALDSPALRSLKSPSSVEPGRASNVKAIGFLGGCARSNASAAFFKASAASTWAELAVFVASDARWFAQTAHPAANRATNTDAIVNQSETFITTSSHNPKEALR